MDGVDVADVAKAVLTARLGVTAAAAAAAAADSNAEREKFRGWATAERADDAANLQAYSDPLTALAAASVDWGRAAADVVQKSAAAVATLYTGALALVFSVTSNPLPLRGLLTPVFLGLAVTLSTAYVAFFGPRAADLDEPPTHGKALTVNAYARLNSFLAISANVATRRSGLLRASVVALGIGLVFLAARSWAESQSRPPPCPHPRRWEIRRR